MKKFKLFIVMFATAFFLPVIANADDNTLQTRINEAKDGDTVTLEDNFTGSYLFISDKKITLDLGNNNITTTDYAAIYISGGEVTIKGTGKIESESNSAISAYNEAKVNIQNVKLKGGYHGISLGNTNNLTSATATIDNAEITGQEFGIAVFVDSVLTFNSGTVTAADNCALGGNGSANYIKENGITITINGGTINGNIQTSGYTSCGIYLPQKSKTTINAGTINSSKGAGIVMRGGELIVNGGTINAKGDSTFTGKVGDSPVQVPVSGIVIDLTKKTGYTDAPNIKVTVGGEANINGTKQAIECIPGDAGQTCNVTLKNGVYSSAPNPSDIQEGYKAYKVLNVEEDEEKYIVASDDEITNEVISAPVTKEDIEKEDINLLEKAIDSKYKIAGYYEILLTESVGDNIIGIIDEVEENVDVTIGIPTNLEELKDGYTRKYVIIRLHDGKTDVINDVKDNGDGTLTFPSNKFSTYLLAYEDVENTATTPTSNATIQPPKTVDNLLLYGIIGIIGIIGVLFGYKYLKRYSN